MNNKIARAAREIRDPQEVMCGNCARRGWATPFIIAFALWAAIAGIYFLF